MFPELILILTSIFIIVFDLFFKKSWTLSLTLSGLLLSLVQLFYTSPASELFGGQFTLTPVAWWIKMVLLLSVILLIGVSNEWIQKMASKAEMCAILLLTLTGVLFLVSASDLLTIYVSLELATLPLFLLSAWEKGKAESLEAAIKYLLYGGLASAILLFGMSVLYGITGSLYLNEIRDALVISPALLLAITLILASVGFKLSLVPFHMWTPDVYEGAPTLVTAYLSTVSKISGVILFVQIYFKILLPFIPQWNSLLALLSVLTMTLGNLVAIVQNNLKRFMAFSSISQVGYILLGFIIPSDVGLKSVLFYLLVYVITNLIVFGIIINLELHLNKKLISDYRGLSLTHPSLALIMMLALFSLSGIPPLSGFLGKFFLFSVAAENGYHWLVWVAAINSTISLYYYLRIIREMYIEVDPSHPQSQKIHLNKMTYTSLLIATVFMVLIGIFPHFYNFSP